jgi:hypothetical protein
MVLAHYVDKEIHSQMLINWQLKQSQSQVDKHSLMTLNLHPAEISRPMQ